MKYLQLFAIIFLFSCIVFLAHFFLVGSAVYGDGRYYYSYLPAIFISHTINFNDAFQHLNLHAITTPTGLIGNPYAIGPAMSWAVPYMLFYFILGFTNPYGSLLQIPVGIWNCGLVVIGLYVLFLTLSHYFPKRTALLSVLTSFLTTNLFFYGAIDVINSHSASFFFASLLIYLWLKKKKSFQEVILEGLSIGMLMLIRTQDSIFFLLPFSSFLLSPKKELKKILIIIASFGMLLILQFLLWDKIWGNWLISPYLYTNTFSWLHPNVFGVLFGLTSGLLLWTPSIFIAGVGLFLFAKKNKSIGVVMLGIFLLQLYIVSSWNIWWEGASYSARMFISCLPFLSFGFAYIIEKINNYNKSVIFISGLTVLNFSLIIFYLLKFN